MAKRGTAASKRKDALQAKLKERDTKIKQAIAALLKMEADHGRVFVQWLYRKCSYAQKSATCDPQTGEVQMKALLYNEARRSVYIDFRRLAPLDDLMPVELAAEQELENLILEEAKNS